MSKKSDLPVIFLNPNDKVQHVFNFDFQPDIDECDKQMIRF